MRKTMHDALVAHRDPADVAGSGCVDGKAACALRGIVRGRNAGAALARQNNLVTRTAEEICPARAGKRDVHGGAAGNRDRPLFDPKWLRWIQESAVVLIFFDNSWWRARVDRRAGQQRRA